MLFKGRDVMKSVCEFGTELNRLTHRVQRSLLRRVGCGSVAVEVRGQGGHHRLGRLVMGSGVWTVWCCFGLQVYLGGGKCYRRNGNMSHSLCFGGIIIDNN